MIISTPPSLRKDQSPSRYIYQFTSQSPGSHSYIELRKILNQVKKQKQSISQKLRDQQKQNVQLISEVKKQAIRIKQLQTENNWYKTQKRSSRNLIVKDFINCQQSLKNLRQQFIPILTQNYDEKAQITFSKQYLSNLAYSPKYITQESDSSLLLNFEDQYKPQINKSTKNSTQIFPNKNIQSLCEQNTLQINYKIKDGDEQKRINQLIYLLESNTCLHVQMEKVKKQNTEKNGIIAELKETINQIFKQLTRSKVENSSIQYLRDYRKGINNQGKTKKNKDSENINDSVNDTKTETRADIAFQIYNKLKELCQNNMKIYCFNMQK